MYNCGMRTVALASVLIVALSLGCAGAKRNPEQVYAHRYKEAMTVWSEAAQRRDASFEGKIKAIPKPKRRAFIVKDLNDTAVEAETAVAKLDALGTPPKGTESVIKASHEVLAFVARSSRDYADAIERRDKAARKRLEAEFEREMPKLAKRRKEEGNALSWRAGFEEMSKVEVPEGR